MKIFKYLEPDRIDVLEFSRIRFSQPAYLNDPFESLPFLSKLMSESDANILYKTRVTPILEIIENRNITYDDIPEEFRKLIPSDILEKITNTSFKEAMTLISGLNPQNLFNAIATTPADQMNISLSDTLKQSWNDTFGVLSLSQTNKSIPMWSHYSRNHEGFLMEFDYGDVFFKKIKHGNPLIDSLRQVKYSRNRPDIHLLDSSKNDLFSSLMEDVFYTKSSNWKNEREVRIIKYLSDHDLKFRKNNQDIYLFNFDSGKIIYDFSILITPSKIRLSI